MSDDEYIDGHSQAGDPAFSERHWILNEDGDPEPCEDLMRWARWMETADRQVANEERDGVRVSTVFLSLDHCFTRGGIPIIFETMVFGGEHDQEQERYATRSGALEGHRRWVEKVWGPSGVDANNPTDP